MYNGANLGKLNKVRKMETANSNDLVKRLHIPANVLSNQAEYISTVRAGIPGEVVKRAIEIIGSREMFVRLLNTTSANLNRYYRKKTLNRVDTEEVLDTIRVFAQALQIWGDVDTAKSWLNTSVPALAGEIPANLFDTFEGRNWVRQVLRKIEYGEFT
jgi:putative toxin-antitoxin system antitoxin component (TIGR02293 family)